MVEVEDAYTQELMAGDDREQELRTRVARLEDQVGGRYLEYRGFRIGI